MRGKFILLTLLLFFLNLIPASDGRAQVKASPPAAKGTTAPNADIWVTAYLTAWELNMGSNTNGNYGTLPVGNIDWTAFTDLILFNILPNSTGNLNYDNVVSSRRKPFTDIAHAHGKPVLVALGGWGSTQWNAACTEPALTNFINNVLKLIDVDGFDGIDMDVEPFRNSGTNDTAHVGPFLRRLYDSLQTRTNNYTGTGKPKITAAILPGWAGEFWVKHEGIVDQINIMTYDMGNSLGFGVDRTWHNNGVFSPVPYSYYSGTNRYYESVQHRYNGYITGRKGTPSKTGIGIDFNGVLYKGGRSASKPDQGVSTPAEIWSTTPTITWDYNFNEMFPAFLDTATPASIRYDSANQGAYLSIVKPAAAASNPSMPWLDDAFLSYTDSAQIERLIRFVRDSGAGGVILWNIGEGYLPSRYANRDRMLQYVKTAVGNIGNPPPPPPKPKIEGTLFFDQNQNGSRGAGERPMAGWRVTLAGTATGSTLTDSAGEFLFGSLETGNYTVTLQQKSGWSRTVPSSSYSYSVVIDSAGQTIDLTYGLYSPQAFSFPVTKAWNIVSVPVAVGQMTPSDVFPLGVTPAYAFHGQYEQKDLLINGEGYWLKFDTGHDVWLSGTTRTTDTVDVSPGWNFLGSVSTPISVDNLRTLPGGILSPYVYGYNHGFYLTESIQPGCGYWVSVSEAGRIIVSSIPAGAAESEPEPAAPEGPGLGTLTFISGSGDRQVLYYGFTEAAGAPALKTYPAPPGPPDVPFRARYGGAGGNTEGAAVAIIHRDLAGPVGLPVAVRGITYPMSIEWDVPPGNPDIALSWDGGDAGTLFGRGSMAVDDPASAPGELNFSLRVSPAGPAGVPVKFSMDQNFPNPFNSSTVIRFSLPTETPVRVEIFNIVGELVMTVADRSFPAGHHTLPVDAAGLASGVYVYRFTGNAGLEGMFTDSKKLLILR